MSEEINLSAESASFQAPHRLNATSRVVEFIATHPKSSTREIAKGTRLSTAAVRYIVSDLLAQDIIVARSSLDQPGKRGRGRPTSLYVLKKALLITTPPRRYWQLSDRLIATLLDEMGAEATERIFRSMGLNAAQATAEIWSQTSRFPMSLESFRQKLRQELNQVGYNANLTLSNKRITITTRNCLYGEVSRKYEGLLCNFHMAYYPNLLKLVCNLNVQTIGRKGCMARGDAQCSIELYIT